MKKSSCYKRLLEIVGSVFDAYSVVLIEPTAQEEKYRIAAFFSLGDKINTDGVIETGKGLVGWVIRSEKPLLVNNVDQHKNHLGYYIKNEDVFIKAFMACPLGNGRGVLCVDSKRQYSFAEKDQKILHLFVNLVLDIDSTLSASAVSKNSETYYHAIQAITTLQKKFSSWPTYLHHFLEILSAASGFPYCFFTARDGVGKKYFLEGENVSFMAEKDKNMEFPMGMGLVGWVFLNGGNVFESDASRKTHLFGSNVSTPIFQSVVCLPLVIHRVIRGVLCLTHEQTFAIDDDLKTFLLISANYLTLFLENLYLKNKLHVTATSLEKFSHSSRVFSEPSISAEK